MCGGRLTWLPSYPLSSFPVMILYTALNPCIVILIPPRSPFLNPVQPDSPNFWNPDHSEFLQTNTLNSTLILTRKPFILIPLVYSLTIMQPTLTHNWKSSVMDPSLAILQSSLLTATGHCISWARTLNTTRRSTPPYVATTARNLLSLKHPFMFLTLLPSSRALASPTPVHKFWFSLTRLFKSKD